MYLKKNLKLLFFLSIAVKVLPSVRSESRSPLIDVYASSLLSDQFLSSSPRELSSQVNAMNKERTISITEEQASSAPVQFTFAQNEITSPALLTNEISDTYKKSIQIGAVLTASALATAGVLHYREQNKKPITRGGLIEAGDIFGAGGVAQGAGSIVKGVALAIAAGGAVYMIRKFYGLIDHRFETIEEKHKMEQELALRKRDEEWSNRLNQGLANQNSQVNNIVTKKIQEFQAQQEKDKKLILNVVVPLTTAVEDLQKDLDREKERTHRRIEPIIDSLVNINDALKKQIEKGLSPTDSTLRDLQHNITEIQNVPNSSSSDDDSVNNPLSQAQKALNEVKNQPVHTVTHCPVPSIQIIAPAIPVQEKSCCPC